MAIVGHSILSASAGSPGLGVTGSIDIMGDGAPATDGGYVQFDEITAPGNPASNKGRLYVADDSGTTTIYFKDSGGTATSLMGGGSSTPGGADTQVQYNNGSSFDGISGLTYTKGTGVLLLTGSSQLNFRDSNNSIHSSDVNFLTVESAGAVFISGSTAGLIQDLPDWTVGVPVAGVGGGLSLRQLGAGAGMTAGAVYYFSGSGTWTTAQASHVESGSMNFMAVAGSPSIEGDMFVNGPVNVAAAQFDGGIPSLSGSVLYLSKNTAGSFTATAPTGSGEVVKVLGHCIGLDTTQALVWFNPESGWIELS